MSQASELRRQIQDLLWAARQCREIAHERDAEAKAKGNSEEEQAAATWLYNRADHLEAFADVADDERSKAQRELDAIEAAVSRRDHLRLVSWARQA